MILRTDKTQHLQYSSKASIMKTTITLLLAFMMLSCHSPTQVTQPTSVEEEFVSINTDELNLLLHDQKNLNPVDVMNLHYPTELEYSEGNERIDITEKALNQDHILITLIHDNMLDDALKAEKHIMEVRKSDGQWSIISLRKNWKCRAGRGHTNWGIEYCL